MRGRGVLATAALVWVLSAFGCVFRPQPAKGIIGYRDGRVLFSKESAYRVGDLPEGWRRMRTGAWTVSFYNEAYRASISTDAFCGRGFGDMRLDALGGDIVSALEDRRLLSEEALELDGRGAIRQKVAGSMDGVPVVVDLVVVRKDGCAFDFYSVAPPGADPAVEGAFEAFFGGFRFRRGR